LKAGSWEGSGRKIKRLENRENGGKIIKRTRISKFLKFCNKVEHLLHQKSPEIFAQPSYQLKEKFKNIVAKYGKQLEMRPNIIP
jgi:hypothetical protein